MIILECPSCKNEIKHNGQYDENMDEQVTCHSCSWTSSKWSFNYIREEKQGGE